MENMFGKSKSPRSPTRLQRRAPTALHLDHVVPDNPFLQQPCDSVAIPLLSPLYVSPDSHSSLSTEEPLNQNQPTSPSREEQDFTFPLSITEKKSSQPSTENKYGWQYSSAKTDHSDQICLLDMFKTKFVLVDHSQ